jgi:protein ImuB
MRAFSANRRRILSLWLPRLPIDRIKRQLGGKAFSSEVGTGSHSNQVYADCVDLSAVENASRKNSSGSLDNAPSVVVAKHNNALQIFALDDAAARCGLAAGLPLANARAICPDLTVFDADPAADARTLNDIADWCDRFTPLVALDPPDGLFLDITGCAHLFGGRADAARLCRQRGHRGDVGLRAHDDAPCVGKHHRRG